MKLIEKKCPNCGAGLKFDKDDTEVSCEYCKKSYLIQRDDVNTNTDEKEVQDHIEDSFHLRQKKGIAMQVTTLIIIGITVFMFMFIGVFFNVISDIDLDFDFDTRIPEKTKEVYVTDISQIDEKSLEIFHDETKESLTSANSMLWSDCEESEWQYAGMYLLMTKNSDFNMVDSVNILYDVYKKEYTGDYEMDVYAAVSYSDLKLLEDGTVEHPYNGFLHAPMKIIGKGSKFISGYEGNEELYNKLIRNRRGDYTILSTEGMYMES